jgi:type I restriction enzyme S subunit
MKLSVNPRIADPLFFYYVFRSAEQQDYIRQHAIQTGVPHTNLGILGQTPIPLPPINEQRAIAHILGTLDDRIELNRRMNETLEAMARALFKSWFIDFDPARRNMASRKGQNQPSPGFQPPSPSGRGKGGEGVVEGHAFDHLFPDSLVDSELGDIPEGWDIGSLADLSALNPEVWTSETRPTKLNYVDLSNTKSGQIAAVATYEAVDAPSRAQRVLRPRDTIVGTVRPGNRSYAFISEQGLTGSTGFAVLRPQRTDWAEFVYLTATAADNIDALAHLADGAAYPAVRPEMVAATPIVRPNEGVLARFSLSVGPFFAKIARNQAASRTLAVLRDTLLPKLISGELRIKNIERFVEVST